MLLELATPHSDLVLRGGAGAVQTVTIGKKRYVSMRGQAGPLHSGPLGEVHHQTALLNPTLGTEHCSW